MKTFQRSAKLLLLILFISLVFSSNSQGQNWNAKQKDVWKDVVAYNNLFAKGDANGFFNYFAPSYMGWSYRNEKPGSFEDMKKGVTDFFNSGNKVQIGKITPIAISVLGDFAFVDYTIDGTMTGKDSKAVTDNERWTDILQKKNGKWMLIGDQGGDLSQLKINGSPAVETNQIVWNDEQNEILNTEKNLDEEFSAGDIDKIGNFYSPDYVDFSYNSDKTHGKEETINMLSKMFSAGYKFKFIQMIPYAVIVDKDFAFVDYLAIGSITDSSGIANNDTERWTDILQKKDGKWILIGDHGGGMPMKKQ
ncbi:MAG TPA: nuclear transport factor 2 family protein [Hanamia sp.]|nr:nuclear transport factor 2 family protein [Hanamia sp.]